MIEDREKKGQRIALVLGVALVLICLGMWMSRSGEPAQPEQAQVSVAGVTNFDSITLRDNLVVGKNTTLGSGGLGVTGNISLSNGALVNTKGAVTVTDQLAVTSQISALNGVAATGNVTVGTNLDVVGNISMSDGVLINTKGAVTLTDTIWVTGSVNVGSNAGALRKSAIGINHYWYDTSLDHFGLYASANYSPTSLSELAVIGLLGYAHGHGEYDAGDAIGLWAEGDGGPQTARALGGHFIGRNSVDNAGDSEVVQGLETEAQVNAGTVPIAYSAVVSAPSVTSGSIGTGYGIYVVNGLKASGTITQQYGLYLEPMTSGGTNYSIYSAGGQSYHEGDFLMGGGALINSKGNVTVTDHLSVGSNPPPFPGAVIAAGDSVYSSTASNLYGLFFVVGYNPASDASKSVYGVNGTATNNGPGKISNVVGVNATATSASTNTLTLLSAGSFTSNASNGKTGYVTTTYGLVVTEDVEDTKSTTAYGIRVDAADVDTGAITTSYGIYIGDGEKGAGVIDNEYGLYLETIDAGTSNYAIYSAGGESYHAGRFRMGMFLNYTAGTTQTITSWITPTATYWPITSAAWVSPTLSVSGYKIGDTVMLVNGGANNIFLQDTGTLKLNSDFTMTVDDVLGLLFDGTNWLETHRSAN